MFVRKGRITAVVAYQAGGSGQGAVRIVLTGTVSTNACWLQREESRQHPLCPFADRLCAFFLSPEAWRRKFSGDFYLIHFFTAMNLYSLLQASATDPVSPNILLNVTLADLHQLVVDTIDATRDRLLPLLMKAEEDRLLTKAEVCAKLGIKPTSVWNLVQKGKLTAIKVGRSSRYKLSEVTTILDSKND